MAKELFWSNFLDKPKGDPDPKIQKELKTFKQWVENTTPQDTIPDINELFGEIGVMDVNLPKNTDNPEYQYTLWDNDRETDKSEDFARRLMLDWKEPSLAFHPDWRHSFEITFNVDSVPVVKESTKRRIRLEAEYYNIIAEHILSGEDRDELMAKILEWDYDSDDNRYLAFNRAMNAIISTYFIGISALLPGQTNRKFKIEKAKEAKSLAELSEIILSIEYPFEPLDDTVINWRTEDEINTEYPLSGNVWQETFDFSFSEDSGQTKKKWKEFRKASSKRIPSEMKYLIWPNDWDPEEGN